MRHKILLLSEAHMLWGSLSHSSRCWEHWDPLRGMGETLRTVRDWYRDGDWSWELPWFPKTVLFYFWALFSLRVNPRFCSRWLLLLAAANSPNQGETGLRPKSSALGTGYKPRTLRVKQVLLQEDLGSWVKVKRRDKKKHTEASGKARQTTPNLTSRAAQISPPQGWDGLETGWRLHLEARWPCITEDGRQGRTPPLPTAGRPLEGRHEAKDGNAASVRQCQTHSLPSPQPHLSVRMRTRSLNREHTAGDGKRKESGRSEASRSHPAAKTTWCEELTPWKRPWCWERLEGGGEGIDRGWDGWVAALTQWTWVWESSGRWWWTWKPGVLRSMDTTWATELNWTELRVTLLSLSFLYVCAL